MASEYDSLLEEPPKQSEYDALLPKPKQEGGVVSGIVAGLGRALNPINLVKGALDIGQPSDISNIVRYGKTLGEIVTGTSPDEAIGKNIPELQQQREAVYGKLGGREQAAALTGIGLQLGMVAAPFLHGRLRGVPEIAPETGSLAEQAGIAKPDAAQPEPPAQTEAVTQATVPEVLGKVEPVAPDLPTGTDVVSSETGISTLPTLESRPQSIVPESPELRGEIEQAKYVLEHNPIHVDDVGLYSGQESTPNPNKQPQGFSQEVWKQAWNEANNVSIRGKLLKSGAGDASTYENIFQGKPTDYAPPVQEAPVSTTAPLSTQTEGEINAEQIPTPTQPNGNVLNSAGQETGISEVPTNVSGEGVPKGGQGEVLREVPQEQVAPSLKELVDRYDSGDENIQTVRDLVDEIDAQHGNNPEVQAAVEKYRADQEENMQEFGGRGDEDQIESDFLNSIQKISEKPSPVSLPTESTTAQPLPEEGSTGIKPVLRSPDEIPGAIKSKPAVYQSTQKSQVTKKPMTAVNWKKLSGDLPTTHGYESVLEAWQKTKDAGTGYTSWDDLAKSTGMDVGNVAQLVKGVWNRDPEAVSFTVNRMGDGVYVKIKKPELFKTEPLTDHWTEIQKAQTETGVRPVPETPSVPEEESGATASSIQKESEVSGIKEPVVQTTAAGTGKVSDEPHISTIANRFTEERTKSGELGEIAPGQGYSTKELADAGLKMSPEQINQHVSDLMNGTGDPIEQGKAVRAEEARLSQRSNDLSRIADADPKNIEARTAADNAFKDLTDFHNGPVARAKQIFHGLGMSMQGELPVDLSTFNGLREAFLRDTGKLPSPEVEPQLRAMAEKVSNSVKEDNGAKQSLGDAIQRATRGKLPTYDEVRANIMERMKDVPCRV